MRGSGHKREGRDEPPPASRWSASPAFRPRSDRASILPSPVSRNRFEDQVTRHQHTQRKARPDRDRRRDIGLTLDELPPSLIDRVLRTVSQRTKQFIIVVGGKLCSDAEQGRYQRRL